LRRRRRWRLPEFDRGTKKHDLEAASIEDLVAYQSENDSLIVKKEDFMLKTDLRIPIESLSNKLLNGSDSHWFLDFWETGITTCGHDCMNSTQVNNDLSTPIP
jgi:hypothetical protein